MPIDSGEGQELNESYIQALLLAKVIERTLKQKANIDLSRKPTFEVKPIVEFMHRMRVGGLGKFDVATYISAVNFYKDEKSMKKDEALGAIIIYIGEDYIVELFKKMGYPKLEEDAHDELEDACGTLCNIIAAKFKGGLIQLGYVDLPMSHFSSYRNEVLQGIAYHYSQNEKYEISFEVDGVKRIVADLTMAHIPESNFQFGFLSVEESCQCYVR